MYIKEVLGTDETVILGGIWNFDVNQELCRVLQCFYKYSVSRSKA